MSPSICSEHRLPAAGGGVGMPWEPTIDATVLAVHAAFLNFDRVVYFGGDQHDPQLAASHQTDATCLFNAASGTVTRISSPHFDAFCSGHALTVDGTLMVAG